MYKTTCPGYANRKDDERKMAMKKACYITLALVGVAAGVLLIYYLTTQSANSEKGKIKGTLVKEYGQWKMYYI